MPSIVISLWSASNLWFDASEAAPLEAVLLERAADSAIETIATITTPATMTRLETTETAESQQQEMSQGSPIHLQSAQYS